MSKKQHHHLIYFLSLTVAGGLLCFPQGIDPFTLDTDTILPALACGALALSLARLLLKLGPLPAPLRGVLLLPLACTPFVPLLLAPGPLTVLFLLLPFALLFLHNGPRLHPLPKTAQFAAFFVILSLGALTLFQRAVEIPSRTPPRLPTHSLLWLSILVVIPLGLASRGILRPLAKALFRYQVLTFLSLLALYPLVWTAATSFKVPGEPAIRFHDLRPQPRFFRLPSVGSDDLLSSELRNHPKGLLILRTLDEMIWRLSDVAMRQAVPADAPLPPADMIRAMKLYGFLLEDRHGSFVPGESFTRPAPPQMKEGILPWFRKSLDRVVISPPDLTEVLSISPEESRALLRDMRRMNLVAPVPGPDERFRLTPQARHPLENDLTPRRILLFSEPVPAGDPVEIETWTYARRWELSYAEVREELGDLVELEAATTKTVWRWNQHRTPLLDAGLRQHTAIWILGFVLALLAGTRLPLLTASRNLLLPTLPGLLLIVQFPLPPPLIWNLRIALGLWLLRHLIPDRPELQTRLCFFAATLFLSSLPMHTLPADTPLVHHTAWILLYTPAAILTLFLAVRPFSKLRTPSPKTGIPDSGRND
ncbi:MAG: hypothetical protein WD708_10450 [Kiritimatiellia bacterium]